MLKVGAAEQDLHLSTAGKVAVKTEDLAAAVENPTGFDPMEEEDCCDKDMWLDRDQDSLLDVNEASIFYDDFPPLPDFPCMSSSSSSSSTQPASKPTIAGTSSSSSATSSSPAASWAVMRSDAEDQDTSRMSFQQLQEEVKMEAAAAATLSSTASMEMQPDCIDVMENFGYMDLIDCNELWDPSSVFQSENPQDLLEEQQAAPPVTEMACEEEQNDGFSFLQGNSELAMIFFEWLKQNKDYISAEDMRSIKLKRSTIESASKRLGSTKEGKKQLLKLILEWVEQYQLQKKGSAAAAAQSPFAFEETVQIPDPNPNPNPNPNFMYNPDPNATFPTTQWMQPEPPPAAAPPSFAPQMPGYSGDPYSNTMPMNHGVVNGIPYQHAGEYPVMEHAPSWAMSPFPVPPSQFSPFPDNGGGVINRQQSLYGNPYQMFADPNGERMMRLGSSATKEARKKRMARQRRLYSHHHRHSSNSNQNQNQLNDPRAVGDGVDDGDQGGSPRDWLYWSAGGGASSPNVNVLPADVPQPNSGDRPTMQPQNCQRQAAAAAPSDRRQQQVGFVLGVSGILYGFS